MVPRKIEPSWRFLMNFSRMVVRDGGYAPSINAATTTMLQSNSSSVGHALKYWTSRTVKYRQLAELSEVSIISEDPIDREAI